ncbi:hypothetical protein SCHPADRAFT_461114 [Schizopora paradoxa]|uniref:F-box domain-containing protein n=1 Tax=Schizopora paradoxa TaxID=27342 RepID=A0A0H2S3W4_9AGAM|nr:hypothetical protein SCHPADRAFT_461114 [Schizopora paradoxa]
MAERLKRTVSGKKCLDKEGFLETFKNPRVRMNVRLGKLSGFVKMPLDVVLEIAVYLQPPDILHLARTTRQLRSFFLSKRASSLWTKLFDSLKIPTCPDDLGMPALLA